MNQALLVSLCLLAAVLGAPGQALAQKGKPPSSLPGTAQFRCPGDCSLLDRIVGDGSNYPGIGTPESGQGAHLNSSNQMWIGFGEGRYDLYLDFSAPDLFHPAPCQPSSCRLPYSPNNVITIDNEDGEFQSRVLGPNDSYEPALDGLLAMPVNATWRTRLKIHFDDPLGRGLLWTLSFNTIDYGDATNINVTRTSVCTWDYEAGLTDRGGLYAFGNAANGKRVRSDEGLYIMPFRITFSVCP